MIVLDTHIWFWWVQGAPELSTRILSCLEEQESSGLVVSAISLLEISCATALGRMELPLGVEEWLSLAIAYPGLRVSALSPSIVAEAYRLPGAFHKDPADRLIVATARVMNCPVLTMDEKILAYPHVAHV